MEKREKDGYCTAHTMGLLHDTKFVNYAYKACIRVEGGMDDLQVQGQDTFALAAGELAVLHLSEKQQASDFVEQIISISRCALSNLETAAAVSLTASNGAMKKGLHSSASSNSVDTGGGGESKMNAVVAVQEQVVVLESLICRTDELDSLPMNVQLGVHMLLKIITTLNVSQNSFALRALLRKLPGLLTELPPLALVENTVIAREVNVQEKLKTLGFDSENSLNRFQQRKSRIKRRQERARKTSLASTAHVGIASAINRVLEQAYNGQITAKQAGSGGLGEGGLLSALLGLSVKRGSLATIANVVRMLYCHDSSYIIPFSNHQDLLEFRRPSASMSVSLMDKNNLKERKEEKKAEEERDEKEEKQGSIMNNQDADQDLDVEAFLEELASATPGQVVSAFQRNERCDIGGILMTWGKGDHGKLGHGRCLEADPDPSPHRHEHCPDGNCTENVKTPKLVKDLEFTCIRKVVSLSTHSLALTADGVLYTWGNGDKNRLGHGSTNKEYYPRVVNALRTKPPVKDVACGLGHTLALLENGQVYAWGNGGNGRLGLGDTDDRTVATLVTKWITDPTDEAYALNNHKLANFRMPEGVTIVDLYCGASHSMATTDDGLCFTWGKNNQGQCGHGDATDKLHPTLVQGLAKYKTVTEGKGEDTCAEGKESADDEQKTIDPNWAVQCMAGGWEHTVVLTADGRLFSFGSGYKDSRRSGLPPVLGHGGTERELYPRQILALQNETIAYCACGWDHTLAVTENGHVYTWGAGTNGKLGHGDEDSQALPQKVQALLDMDAHVVQVEAGCEHSVAVTDEGYVYTWGHGDSGRLGHTSNRTEKRPKLVQNLVTRGLPVLYVAVGDKYNLILTEPYDDTENIHAGAAVAAPVTDEQHQQHSARKLKLADLGANVDLDSLPSMTPNISNIRSQGLEVQRFLPISEAISRCPAFRMPSEEDELVPEWMLAPSRVALFVLTQLERLATGTIAKINTSGLEESKHSSQLADQGQDTLFLSAQTLLIPGALQTWSDKRDGDISDSNSATTGNIVTSSNTGDKANDSQNSTENQLHASLMEAIVSAADGKDNLLLPYCIDSSPECLKQLVALLQPCLETAMTSTATVHKNGEESNLHRKCLCSERYSGSCLLDTSSNDSGNDDAGLNAQCSDCAWLAVWAVLRVIKANLSMLPAVASDNGFVATPRDAERETSLAQLHELLFCIVDSPFLDDQMPLQVPVHFDATDESNNEDSAEMNADADVAPWCSCFDIEAAAISQVVLEAAATIQVGFTRFYPTSDDRLELLRHLLAPSSSRSTRTSSHSSRKCVSEDDSGSNSGLDHSSTVLDVLMVNLARDGAMMPLVIGMTKSGFDIFSLLVDLLENVHHPSHLKLLLSFQSHIFTLWKDPLPIGSSEDDTRSVLIRYAKLVLERVLSLLASAASDNEKKSKNPNIIDSIASRPDNELLTVYFSSLLPSLLCTLIVVKPLTDETLRALSGDLLKLLEALCDNRVGEYLRHIPDGVDVASTISLTARIYGRLLCCTHVPGVTVELATERVSRLTKVALSIAGAKTSLSQQIRDKAVTELLVHLPFAVANPDSGVFELGNPECIGVISKADVGSPTAKKMAAVATAMEVALPPTLSMAAQGAPDVLVQLLCELLAIDTSGSAVTSIVSLLTNSVFANGDALQDPQLVSLINALKTRLDAFYKNCKDPFGPSVLVSSKTNGQSSSGHVETMIRPMHQYLWCALSCLTSLVCMKPGSFVGARAELKSWVHHELLRVAQLLEDNAKQEDRLDDVLNDGSYVVPQLSAFRVPLRAQTAEQDGSGRRLKSPLSPMSQQREASALMAQHQLYTEDQVLSIDVNDGNCNGDGKLASQYTNDELDRAVDSMFLSDPLLPRTATNPLIPPDSMTSKSLALSFWISLDQAVTMETRRKKEECWAILSRCQRREDENDGLAMTDHPVISMCDTHSIAVHPAVVLRSDANGDLYLDFIVSTIALENGTRTTVLEYASAPLSAVHKTKGSVSQWIHLAAVVQTHEEKRSISMFLNGKLTVNKPLRGHVLRKCSSNLPFRIGGLDGSKEFQALKADKCGGEHGNKESNACTLSLLQNVLANGAKARVSDVVWHTTGLSDEQVDRLFNEGRAADRHHRRAALEKYAAQLLVLIHNALPEYAENGKTAATVLRVFKASRWLKVQRAALVLLGDVNTTTFGTYNEASLNYSVLVDEMSAVFDRLWFAPVAPDPNNTVATDIKSCQSCCATIDGSFNSNGVNGYEPSMRSILFKQYASLIRCRALHRARHEGSIAATEGLCGMCLSAAVDSEGNFLPNGAAFMPLLSKEEEERRRLAADHRFALQHEIVGFVRGLVQRNGGSLDRLRSCGALYVLVHGGAAEGIYIGSKVLISSTAVGSNGVSASSIESKIKESKHDTETESKHDTETKSSPNNLGICMGTVTAMFDAGRIFRTYCIQRYYKYLACHSALFSSQNDLLMYDLLIPEEAAIAALEVAKAVGCTTTEPSSPRSPSSPGVRHPADKRFGTIWAVHGTRLVRDTLLLEEADKQALLTVHFDRFCTKFSVKPLVRSPGIAVDPALVEQDRIFGPFGWNLDKIATLALEGSNKVVWSQCYKLCPFSPIQQLGMKSTNGKVEMLHVLELAKTAVGLFKKDGEGDGNSSKHSSVYERWTAARNRGMARRVLSVLLKKLVQAVVSDPSFILEGGLFSGDSISFLTEMIPDLLKMALQDKTVMVDRVIKQFGITCTPATLETLARIVSASQTISPSVVEVVVERVWERMQTDTNAALVKVVSTSNKTAPGSPFHIPSACNNSNKVAARLESIGGPCQIDQKALRVQGASEISTVRLAVSVSSLDLANAKWFFEVVLLTDQHMQVGWVGASFEEEEELLTSLSSGNGLCLGAKAHSWAFNGYLGTCRSNSGAGEAYGTGIPWQVGDVVGSLLDVAEKTIRYFVNGKDLGVAFTGVDVSNGAVSPAVSLTMGQSARFVLSSFNHPPVCTKGVLSVLMCVQASTASASAEEAVTSYGSTRTVEVDDTEEGDVHGTQEQDDEQQLISNDARHQNALGDISEAELSRRQGIIDALLATGLPLDWCRRAVEHVARQSVENSTSFDENAAISWVMEEMMKEGSQALLMQSLSNSASTAAGDLSRAAVDADYTGTGNESSTPFSSAATRTHLGFSGAGGQHDSGRSGRTSGLGRMLLEESSSDMLSLSNDTDIPNSAAAAAFGGKAHQSEVVRSRLAASGIDGSHAPSGWHTCGSSGGITALGSYGASSSPLFIPGALDTGSAELGKSSNEGKLIYLADTCRVQDLSVVSAVLESVLAIEYARSILIGALGIADIASESSDVPGLTAIYGQFNSAPKVLELIRLVLFRGPTLFDVSCKAMRNRNGLSVGLAMHSETVIGRALPALIASGGTGSGSALKAALLEAALVHFTHGSSPAFDAVLWGADQLVLAQGVSIGTLISRICSELPLTGDAMLRQLGAWRSLETGGAARILLACAINIFRDPMHLVLSDADTLLQPNLEWAVYVLRVLLDAEEVSNSQHAFWIDDNLEEASRAQDNENGEVRSGTSTSETSNNNAHVVSNKVIRTLMQAAVTPNMALKDGVFRLVARLLTYVRHQLSAAGPDLSSQQRAVIVAGYLAHVPESLLLNLFTQRIRKERSYSTRHSAYLRSLVALLTAVRRLRESVQGNGEVEAKTTSSDHTAIKAKLQIFIGDVSSDSVTLRWQPVSSEPTSKYEEQHFAGSENEQGACTTTITITSTNTVVDTGQTTGGAPERLIRMDSAISSNESAREAQRSDAEGSLRTEALLDSTHSGSLNSTRSMIEEVEFSDNNSPPQIKTDRVHSTHSDSTGSVDGAGVNAAITTHPTSMGANRHVTCTYIVQFALGADCGSLTSFGASDLNAFGSFGMRLPKENEWRTIAEIRSSSGWEEYTYAELFPDTPYRFRIGYSHNNGSPTIWGPARGVDTKVRSQTMLSRSACGPNLRISNSNMTVRNVVNKRWNAVRCTISLSKGIHCWSVRIDHCGSKNIFIGVMSGQAQINNYVGADQYGFGFLANKAIWHGKTKARSYGELYREGDLVTVTLDMDAGTLSFARNGHNLGIAAEGLDEFDELYPAVSLYNKDDQVTIIPSKDADAFLFELAQQPQPQALHGHVELRGTALASNKVGKIVEALEIIESLQARESVVGSDSRVAVIMPLKVIRRVSVLLNNPCSEPFLPLTGIDGAPAINPGLIRRDLIQTSAWANLGSNLSVLTPDGTAKLAGVGDDGRLYYHVPEHTLKTYLLRISDTDNSYRGVCLEEMFTLQPVLPWSSSSCSIIRAAGAGTAGSAVIASICNAPEQKIFSALKENKFSASFGVSDEVTELSFQAAKVNGKDSGALSRCNSMVVPNLSAADDSNGDISTMASMATANLGRLASRVEGWTAAADRELVNFVDDLCKSRDMSFRFLNVRSIPAPSVSRFAALAGIGLDRLQERMALLLHLNTLVLEVVPLLEINLAPVAGDCNSSEFEQCLQSFRLPNAKSSSLVWSPGQLVLGAKDFFFKETINAMEK